MSKIETPINFFSFLVHTLILVNLSNVFERFKLDVKIQDWTRQELLLTKPSKNLIRYARFRSVWISYINLRAKCDPQIHEYVKFYSNKIILALGDI